MNLKRGGYDVCFLIFHENDLTDRGTAELPYISEPAMAKSSSQPCGAKNQRDLKGVHTEGAFLTFLNPILSRRRKDLGLESNFICVWPIHRPCWWRNLAYEVTIVWVIIMIILWPIP